MIDKNFRQKFCEKVLTNSDEFQQYVWSTIYQPIFMSAEKDYTLNYWKAKLLTYFSSAANIISSIIIATFVGFIENSQSSSGERIVLWCMVGLSILGAISANIRDSHQKEYNLSLAVIQKFYSESRQYMAGTYAYKNATPRTSIDLLFTRLEKIKLNASYGNPDAVLSTFENRRSRSDHASVDVCPDI